MLYQEKTSVFVFYCRYLWSVRGYCCICFVIVWYREVPRHQSCVNMAIVTLNINRCPFMWTSHGEAKNVCACTRWASSDSPGVPQGASQVKFRASGGFSQRSNLSLHEQLPASLSFPTPRYLRLLHHYCFSPLSVTSTREASSFSLYFLFLREMRWGHWSSLNSVLFLRLSCKTCFCWRPVNLPSSVKIKCNTPRELHFVMCFRQIRS